MQNMSKSRFQLSTKKGSSVSVPKIGGQSKMGPLEMFMMKQMFAPTVPAGGVPVRQTVQGVTYEFPATAEMAARKKAATEQVSQQTKLSAFNPILDHFEGLLGEIPAESGFGGRVTGALRSASSWTQATPELARIEATKANIYGLRAQLARALGDVGNLSEYEQKQVVKLLPDVADNSETRQYKMRNIRSYINRRLGLPFAQPSSSQVSSMQTPMGRNIEQERAWAKEAIAAGGDPKRIAGAFKRATGQEYSNG